jgi:hypothetical protein
MYRGMRRGRRMVGEREEEGEEEEVSLGVIMTNTEIFHICHIISLRKKPKLNSDKIWKIQKKIVK